LALLRLLALLLLVVSEALSLNAKRSGEPSRLLCLHDCGKGLWGAALKIFLAKEFVEVFWYSSWRPLGHIDRWHLVVHAYTFG
jgi:hypothetical protein